MKKAILFVLLALAGIAHANVETAAQTCANASVAVIVDAIQTEQRRTVSAGEMTKLDPYRADFFQMCKIVYLQGVQSREIKTLSPSRASIYASTRASIAAGNVQEQGAPMPEKVIDGLTNAVVDVYFAGYNAE